MFWHVLDCRIDFLPDKSDLLRPGFGTVPSIDDPIEKLGGLDVNRNILLLKRINLTFDCCQFSCKSKNVKIYLHFPAVLSKIMNQVTKTYVGQLSVKCHFRGLNAI